MIVAITVVSVVVLRQALEKSERYECLKLQSWADSGLVDFYITPDQKKQCDYYGITINAPIKGGGDK